VNQGDILSHFPFVLCYAQASRIGPTSHVLFAASV
jgi:hypothetical protein